MNYLRITDIVDFDETLAIFDDTDCLDSTHEYYLEEIDLHSYNSVKRILSIAIIDWNNRHRYNGNISALFFEKYQKNGMLRKPTVDEKAKLLLMEM
jgi:hypothetical protein